MNRLKKYKNINTIIFAFYLTYIISCIILSNNIAYSFPSYRIIEKLNNSAIPYSEMQFGFIAKVFSDMKIIVDNSYVVKPFVPTHVSYINIYIYIHMYVMKYISASVDNKFRVILKSTRRIMLTIYFISL